MFAFLKFWLIDRLKCLRYSSFTFKLSMLVKTVLFQNKSERTL